MKTKYTIGNPMPPLWMMFPHISQYSIGWRMGYGENYMLALHDWLQTLSEADRKKYFQMFPAPVFWRDLYSEKFEDEDIEQFECGSISFWEPYGAPKFSIDDLESTVHKAEDFIYFWEHNNEVIDKSCLVQWRDSKFKVDTEEYCCAEQYMMAEKARLFYDETNEALIMNSTSPKEIKALGRKVKDFDSEIWNNVKYSIVLAGNYYKFTQNKAMRDFLFSTGDKILVEASPVDKIWGIGLSEDEAKTKTPQEWQGENLMGFALMEVRKDLKRAYKNYDTINWEQVNKEFR